MKIRIEAEIDHAAPPAIPEVGVQDRLPKASSARSSRPCLVSTDLAPLVSFRDFASEEVKSRFRNYGRTFIPLKTLQNAFKNAQIDFFVHNYSQTTARGDGEISQKVLSGGWSDQSIR